MNLIDYGGMNRILRWGHVDRANHLLHRRTVGRKRRRVLILGAYIERNRARRSRCRSPAHQVRTLAVETAVVIDQGLAEVITVVKRCPGDAEVTRINAIYAEFESPRPVQACKIIGEFGCECGVEWVRLCRLVVDARVVVVEISGARITNALVIAMQIVYAQGVSGGSDDPGALHARPGP